MDRTFRDLNHLHVSCEEDENRRSLKIRLPFSFSLLISFLGGFFFFFFLQDSPDRKLHIMFSRRTYRINSNSPKKDKAGGQNNPLLLNSHTHIDTHSIFRWFSRHTIEGEICFLSPRRLSIDDLRRKPTPCPYLCSSSLLSMM